MRSLKDIIRNDSSIMDNTVIGYCSGCEKQSILGGQVFCISSLLASVIYYACIEVKNSDCAEAIKSITGEYVKGFEDGEPIYFEGSDAKPKPKLTYTLQDPSFDKVFVKVKSWLINLPSGVTEIEIYKVSDVTNRQLRFNRMREYLIDHIGEYVFSRANPFGFELAGVVLNDSVTREALTRDQMRKFLKFVHDDNVYCKYYEVVYILFHTGMRISEFSGLTIKDIDLGNRIANIDHQLQRLSDMTLVIEPTKTSAGTRKLPVTEDVAKCFKAIIEDREKPKVEKVVDGYTGFLFLDDKGLPLVAMHWEHRFNHMGKRYNDIYRVQMPNITPHVCRHTYCSNMAKSGMNPKTLQYLMGHSDIGVTLNTYTHLGLEDAEDELRRLEDLQNARKELERTQGEKTVSQKMFKAI